jgi:hypothetical protein
MRPDGLLKTATAIILPLAAAALLVAVEFAPELYAFGWHTLHRGVARFQGQANASYEMEIPSSFTAYRPDDCSVSISKQTGPIRSRIGQQTSAQMSFSACQIYTTAREIEANAIKLRNELGIDTVLKETIAVAGQELRCYERAENPTTVVTTLHCVPVSEESELSASFVGSGDHVPAFYTLLKTVKSSSND